MNLTVAFPIAGLGYTIAFSEPEVLFNWLNRQDIVHTRERTAELPQVLEAFTVTLPLTDPHCTSTDEPFEGPSIVAPGGTVHIYPVAPIEPAVEYPSMAPAQGAALPAMAGGVDGTLNTLSVRGKPVPQLLIAETDNTHPVKFAGQSMVTPLKLAGPMMVPHVEFQMYEVANATGEIE
jgi:hypothetical protein